MGKSGQQKAREAVAKLKGLIAQCEAGNEYLPLHPRGSALHLGRICKICGVLRTTVNTNPHFKKLLVEYAGRHGLQYSIKGYVAEEEDSGDVEQRAETMVPAGKLKDASQRLAALSRKNSELVAENARLRSQLRRRDEVAELIALGGRVEIGELDI